MTKPLNLTLATAAMAALAAASAAQAADNRASRIERVTVYPGLAAVERSARVAAGARELVLDCLSPEFDLATLRIEADAAIRIGPVSARNRPRAEVAECSAHPLDGRIRALEDRIATLQAETGGHDLALGFLRGLGAAEAASAPRAAPPPPTAGLPATLAAIQRGGQQALQEQHRLQRERETLERELQPLLAERERGGKPQGSVRQLRIALAAKAEGALRLHYQVAGPTWGPAYRAALDVEAGQVEIERQAQVVQRSGEDWTGVSLRLSTGTPRGATAGPQPRRWEVSPRPPVRERAEMAMSSRSFAVAAAPAPKMARDAGAAEETPDFEVQVVQGEFATEFEVPGAVDVGSGAERVSLSLGSARWPVQLKVQATPALDASAWLVAELARPEGVWPDGPLRLMRGNQVVGQSVFSLGPRERLTLPFGRDEQVRVQVDPAQSKSAETGFIGTRSERRITRGYTVENRRRSPVQLEVLEATPVSTDEKITVARQFSPEPQAGDWQEQPGIKAWRQTLAPGQKQRFTADYLISHPKDMPISESR
ncbi:conserved exported hypothetical protein [Rubrivivax sp. A210]|uniref:DUF4139 domain-containing protein n=1 Tax=Rubrivivax sp. A210 TaxID=2772301 RepID=UPI0019193183|nr:DUF4139 domain-containing protein [Rubrivivax sp. A210]CAD5372516.1 conserved exported hypothetical protein [Rubrivivax sp. A210]